MTVYLFPKNRLITKAVSFRPIPNKWTSKWTTVRRSVSSKGSGYNAGTTGGSSGQQQQQQQQQQNVKGKILIKRKWSWKAGAGWTVLSVLDWWLLAAGGWLTWRGVFLRWTPLGICLVAAAQWHFQNKELESKGLPRTASQWQMNVYCSLPLRLMSRCWGWLADCRVPTPIRPVVYGLYSSTFGVNLQEAASPDFKNYRSLAEFFARRLKENVRIIDEESCVVSPCDGTVLHFGLATNEQIEQVKGVSYSLEAFLGPSNFKNNNNNAVNDSITSTTNTTQITSYFDKIKHENENTALYQCIIYLAPGDYHRFHSPTYWQPQLRRHFSGELLSVSPKIAKWVPGLFCLNERALYIGEWEHGFFSFTAVGATNVGSVEIYMDEKLKTNQWTGLEVGTHKRQIDFDEIKLPNDTILHKGELIGQFNMGSTIVLIFEAPKKFEFNIHSGDKVLMGQPLGCVKDNNIVNKVI